MLIANRGEIAIRILRTCRELGIKTLAIYSDADRMSLHLKYADEAYRIGPEEPQESYLDVGKIIQLAREVGVDAIHPGYGFLAEDVALARGCEQANLIFVGPTSDTLELTGDKIRAKRAVEKAGIPVLPGIRKPIEKDSELVKAAEKIGYPVLMKSVYGGGGRGIRLAHDQEQLLDAFKPAQMESKTSFGKASVYLEKYIEKARHIEFQVLADQHGDIINLGERECSIQRRFQKLIEICPSPIMSPRLRSAMADAAVLAARTVGYTNAGTVEFLLDEKMDFYFIEVNARLQVEHPITEMVTGFDIVREQFRIASGEPLGWTQRSVKLDGVAIECRINAEDPYNDFSPQAGRIEEYSPPSGPHVRVDTHIYSGYEVPVWYDSLIAKVIVWGRTYPEAIRRLNAALEEFDVSGILTTKPFHIFVLNDPDFVDGKLSTDFVESRKIIQTMVQRQKLNRRSIEEIAAIAAAVYGQTISKTRSGNVSQSSSARPVRWREMRAEHGTRGQGRFVDTS